MPRKSPTESEPEAIIEIDHRSDTPPATHELSAEQKLDVIIRYLHRMDRRDQWRTVGGFIRGVFTLVPIIIFLASAWYFYAHGTEFMQQLTDMSVKSISGYNQKGLMDTFNDYIGKPTTK